MTKLSRKDLLQTKGIDIQAASDYDIAKDDIFNKFSNTILPDHIDTSDKGIAPHAGSFGKAEAKHLLSRTLFGFNKATWDTVGAKTVTQAVDDLLNVKYDIGQYP